MPAFDYRAYDPVQRKIITDSVDETSLRSARAHLQQRGYTTLRIIQSDIPTIRAVTKFRAQKGEFYLMLARVAQSGRQPQDFKEDFEEIFVHPKAFARAIFHFLSDKPRSPIHERLKALPAVFGQDEVFVLKVGHENNAQVETLRTLGTTFKRLARMMAKVRSGLIYPLVLTGMLIASVSAFITITVPQLNAIYADLQDTPPIPLPQINAVIWFLGNPWNDLFLVIGIAAAFLGVKALARIKSVAYRMDIALLNAPIVGKLIRAFRLYNILFAMRLLITAGRQKDAISAAYQSARGPVLRHDMELINNAYETKKATSWASSFLETTGNGFPRKISRSLHFGETAPAITRTKPGEAETTISGLEESLEMQLDDLNNLIETQMETLPKVIQDAIIMLYSFIIIGLVLLMLVPVSHATSALH